MDKIHSSIPNCWGACIVYCVLCNVIVQVHISSLPSPQVLEWVIMIMRVFDWDVLLLESISIVWVLAWLPHSLHHLFPSSSSTHAGLGADWGLTTLHSTTVATLCSAHLTADSVGNRLAEWPGLSYYRAATSKTSDVFIKKLVDLLSLDLYILKIT